MTLDRFIAISFLYWYVSWVTRRCISSVLFASWIKAIFLTRVEFVNRHTAVQLFLHRGSDHPHRCIQRGYVPLCQARGQENRLSIPGVSAKTVTIVVATSLMCWAPIMFLPAVVPPCSTNFKRHIKLTLAFTSFSTAIDPFIFCWGGLSDFRSALYTRLRKTRNIILRRAI